MIQIIKQLYFRYKELINYVIVGGLTTVVSLASYYFFTAVFLNPQDPFQLILPIRSHGSAQSLLLTSQTGSSFLKAKVLINCAKC